MPTRNQIRQPPSQLADAVERVSIVKGADWVLCEERGVGAPEAIYGVECLGCGAASPLFDNDPLPVAVWALQHTQQLPEHTRFLSRIERHWRVVRRPDADPEAEGQAAAGPVAAFLDQAAGPAFVGLMCLLTALSGLLPATLN
ncbi:hypothetical protein RM844_30840 [Streptomyces sp. DSM 44915]|uniref:DUF7848 domain-containing protein n=1 Tax=Streptomyces chisholmiae TaxID=3075540 RepID=A0ABU2K095_9ACTN|nr:hypothetical protein [Streptomyces sp. DSM 44915]MDT0270678.1 hypothetical protein [Streptomyces sp. DSM 44915]